MENEKSPVIDVNLTIPNNSLPEELTLSDIILFIWRGKKTLVIGILIGAILGVAAGTIYFYFKEPVTVVTAAIKYLYPDAMEDKTPDGKALNHSMLLASKVIDPLVADGISAADLRSRIVYLKSEDDPSVLDLELWMDDEFAENGLDGSALMEALIKSYRSWFDEEYSRQAQMSQDVLMAEQMWDSFFTPLANGEALEFDEYLNEISWSLNEMMKYLTGLMEFPQNNDKDGTVLSYNNIPLRTLYNDINAFSENQVNVWVEKINAKPYIRHPDKYTQESILRLAELEKEKERLCNLVTQYQAMLTPVNAGEIRLSLESDDTTGTGALMEMIYQCDNEATKIHTAVALIESGENRKNAAEAEAALAIMHTELERIRLVGRELCGANQEILSTAAYQIYDEMIVTIKEPEYVKMYPAETDKKEGGSVVTGYLAFLAGFTIAGIIAAFMVIVIRKALTESHENK